MLDILLVVDLLLVLESCRLVDLWGRSSAGCSSPFHDASGSCNAVKSSPSASANVTLVGGFMAQSTNSCMRLELLLSFLSNRSSSMRFSACCSVSCLAPLPSSGRLSNADGATCETRSTFGADLGILGSRSGVDGIGGGRGVGSRILAVLRMPGLTTRGVSPSGTVSSSGSLKLTSLRWEYFMCSTRNLSIASLSFVFSL
mmetsp:Transcript_92967/g.258969  ORF Transcript_92967/g.258969 Transcript_92967/m.258969 type:complete len:200 (+) Transcript_92967:1246-1845(+)